tara:strand:+ start:987 stop:1217 length:231 start_codon:yes stop_codon:yes gene_type:complete
MDFLEITSSDNWFKKHPEKIAGVEFETTSMFFPIQVKGTKEDVLRVTEMVDTNKIKRLAIAKARAKAIEIRLKLMA